MSGESRFAWLNEPAQWTGTLDESLTIEAPAGADYIVNPVDRSVTASAPACLEVAPERFTLRCRLETEFRETFDSSAIMLYSDDTHWAKMCFEKTEYAAIAVVSVRTDGVSDDCNGVSLDVPSIWLRITRRDSVVAMHYSMDQKSWALHRIFPLWPLHAPLRVGVVAQCPRGSSCTSRFSDYTLEERVVRDLRSGV